MDAMQIIESGAPGLHLVESIFKIGSLLSQVYDIHLWLQAGQTDGAGHTQGAEPMAFWVAREALDSSWHNGYTMLYEPRSSWLQSNKVLVGYTETGQRNISE